VQQAAGQLGSKQQTANSVFNVAAINTHRGRSCPVTSKDGPDKQQTTGKSSAHVASPRYICICYSIYISIHPSMHIFVVSWHLCGATCAQFCLIDRLATLLLLVAIQQQQ